MLVVLPVGRNASTCLPEASNRIVTWAGGLAWPGATSANSSLRLNGVLDESDDVAGHAVRDEGVADVHVEGRRRIARSSRSRRRRSGNARRRGAASDARTSRSGPRRGDRRVLSDPGIAMLWWSISSIVPKARCAAATSARSAPENVITPVAVPIVGSRPSPALYASATPTVVAATANTHQRQHEHLLAPLATEQSPRPTEDRAPRRPATGAGRRPIRRGRSSSARLTTSLPARAATRVRPAASSDPRRARRGGTPPGRPTTPVARRA